MTAPMFKIAKEFIYSVILGLETQHFIKVGVVSFAADARLGLDGLKFFDFFILIINFNFLLILNFGKTKKRT